MEHKRYGYGFGKELSEFWLNARDGISGIQNETSPVWVLYSPITIQTS
jgi:hypothetical protein